MDKLKLGFCLTGSFCTFSQVIPHIKVLSEKYDILPIMSFNAYNIDSRFGKRTDFIKEIEEYCGKEIIHTIEAAEPIGAKGLCDILVIMPCTGNTAAKLSLGITDTPVTMAAKGHLRNNRPLVIAFSSNDGLGANGETVGRMMNTKSIYFVPYRQDNFNSKPKSLVADFSLTEKTIEAALDGRQIQPVLL